jgi:micrococcal nuclease
MTSPAAAVGCLLAAAACGRATAPHTTPPHTAPPPAVRRSTPMTAVVVRVVDGDTLVLRMRGRPVRVRLIGVDAPETWLRHDCFGAEATRGLRRLTPPGAAVRAAGDTEARDRYGRRLLYLWTPRGVFVNAALVRAGFARAMAVPPDTSRAAVLRDAEDTARRTRAGLWRPDLADCALTRRSSGRAGGAGLASRP